MGGRVSVGGREGVSGKYVEKIDRTNPFVKKDQVSLRSWVAIWGSSPPPEPALAVSVGHSACFGIREREDGYVPYLSQANQALAAEHSCLASRRIRSNSLNSPHATFRLRSIDSG